MQKCGFRKAIIGLSGGIDSALTAVVAADAVGPENVIGVGMPGPYSSQGSIDDARSLAKNLGIRFELLSINPAYQAYRKTLQDVFTGQKEDVTEENIQSRARGTMLMALSNKFGAIVLSTGNKSELGVGYCTLYGDMVGGLAVISDVPKTLVYRLSEYVNSRRRGSRVRYRSREARHPHGRSRRIQAAAGRARSQDFSQSLWLRTPFSDCCQVRSLKPTFQVS
jgi:NAD+ synthetase